MKVIDLLNKIANGEEVPKKIKVDNKIYNYETFNIGKGDNYFTAKWEEVKGYRIDYDGTYYYLEIRDYNLNDEIEIIEEKTINNKAQFQYSQIPEWLEKKEIIKVINENFEKHQKAIYKLIDKINKMEK